MKKFIIPIIAIFILSACAAQQPLIKETQSGYPEGVFASTDIETVKAKIISKCVSESLMLTESSSNMLVFSRQITGNEAIWATLAVGGNAYSATPTHKARFVLNQTGQDVVVVVYEWLESQMAFGQVQMQEIKSNNHANNVQNMLFSLGAK